MSFDPLGPLHAQPRLVTFMTDFGLRDPSAGVLSGVVLGIAPEARTLDLTHAIPPYDVEAGAEALVESLVHLPIGAHVAVVDPGVGTQRRPIAIRCGRGDALIGPDNGLLLPAAAALGGAVAALMTSAGGDRADHRPSTAVTCLRPSLHTWLQGSPSATSARRSPPATSYPRPSCRSRLPTACCTPLCASWMASERWC